MDLPTVVVRGDVLSSWLTISGYTQSQLARELGVSGGRISQLLTSREEPSARVVARLLLVTHLPFDRLFQIIHHHQQSRSLGIPTATRRQLPRRTAPRPRRRGHVAARV